MPYSALSNPDYDMVVEAHGIMGCLAWVIFFPLGAILLRVVPSRGWIIHAAMMFFALIIFSCNVGMGIWQTYVFDSYHQAIGILLFSLAWIQPISGFLHHYLCTRYQRRTIVSFIHMSIGRAIITLGMVNGGLGMLYADGDASRAELIAYGTVAGIVWITYLAIAFVSEDKREKARAQALSQQLSGKVYE